MKRYSLKTLIVLCYISFSSFAHAQMPSGSLGAPTTPSSVMGYGQTQPAADPGKPSEAASGGTAAQPAQPAEAASGGSATQPGDPKTGRSKEQAAATPAAPARPGVPLYDPYMDNHLKAPVAGKEIGFFGLPVKQVEDMLRNSGAKNHSYAFGKYSRMVFSVYLVTLYFDKERKLGGFSIEPRHPYKTVEPGARQFFMDTFLKGADLSKFSIKMASNLLEIKYLP